MSIPQSAAARLALLPPLDEDALDDLLADFGITVIFIPKTIPVDEFRCANVVGIRADLPTSRRLWLKLHALGHVLLHRGDQITDVVDVGRQERQAELFAGFLAGVPSARGLPWEIAEELGLSVEDVTRWAQRVIGEG